MREFRKKQKKLKIIMNVLLIFTAVFVFIYIGVYPAIENGTALLVVNYISYALIIACMVVLFIYYNKYGKSDKFLESVENELSDVGYYFTSRKDNTKADYCDSVTDDLANNGFLIDKKLTINEFDFDVRAVKKNDSFYIVNEANVDKNDILAYLDSTIYDVTVQRLKRRGNAVLLFITDKAEDDAIALSKMITPLGKKEQIKIALAIVELSTNRCYFLGNQVSKCQQMIANFAMNCDVPLKVQFIGKEKLPFQDELEEHMKDFNLKDFKDGTFYAH